MDAKKLASAVPCSVHGRFQPFHNGHLSYVRSALEVCEFIYIGITQVERGMMKTFDAARHRSQLHANPLSFFERQTLIHSVLTDEGISPEQFTIIPFPIERDEILTEYFPIPGRCLTTLHSEWNEVKIKILERVGYSVEVIADPDRFAKRRTSGSNIRAAIRAGDDSWLDYVPSKTAELIRGKLWSRFEM